MSCRLRCAAKDLRPEGLKGEDFGQILRIWSDLVRVGSSRWVGKIFFLGKKTQQKGFPSTYLYFLLDFMVI